MIMNIMMKYIIDDISKLKPFYNNIYKKDILYNDIIIYIYIYIYEYIYIYIQMI